MLTGILLLSFDDDHEQGLVSPARERILGLPSSWNAEYAPILRVCDVIRTNFDAHCTFGSCAVVVPEKSGNDGDVVCALSKVPEISHKKKSIKSRNKQYCEDDEIKQCKRIMEQLSWWYISL
jgi:hypothetical protein